MPHVSLTSSFYLDLSLKLISNTPCTLTHTHTHTHTGTFPVVALMVGTAVTRLTSAADFCQPPDIGNGSGYSNVTMATTAAANLSDPCAQSQCDDLRAEIAVSLSLLVGILMVRWHM